MVFNGIAGDAGFGFPATTTFLQLFFCAVVLTVVDIIKFFLTGETSSWIFGANLLYKIKTLSPIGIAFGLKYGVTNWGLHLLPLAPHLLLQATDLMWTVLFARLINNEKLTLHEFIACVCSTIGTVLIAWRTNVNVVDGGLYAIAVNLVSPILLGFCITSLRGAAQELLNKPGGRTDGMTCFEFTAIKLWISSLVIFPVAFLFENGGIQLFGFPQVSMYAYQVGSSNGWGLPLAATGGGIFILIFQVNITYLSSLVTAVTVGMVGGMKIFPQWIAALVFAGKYEFDTLNLFGACIVLSSSLLFTSLRYELVQQNSKFQTDSITYGAINNE